MRKYKFKLQTLLRTRQIYEEEAERHFRAALRELAIAVENLEQMRFELERAVSDLSELIQHGIDLNIRMLYDDYFRRMRFRISQQTDTVAAARAAAEAARLELVEKMRDRKSIEKLRSRDYEDYIVELRRYEQAIVDDLNILRSRGNQMLVSQEAAV